MLGLEQLAELGAEYLANFREQAVQSFELRGTVFRPYPEASLMGVVNMSPDSWYRESVALSTDAAVRRGLRLMAEGAQVVDLGAESTIPNAVRVEGGGQLQRMVPVIRALAMEGCLVSVETYLAEVAREALEAGAAVINLTGSADSEAIYRAVAEHDAGVIICYVQGDNVRDVGDLVFRGSEAEALFDYFAREIDLAVRCGVRCLWVDPGMGFYYRNLTDGATRVRYQMRTFLNTFRLSRLGWPVCHALPHAFEFFEDEVRTAEPFFAVLAALGQTSLFRTHEVAKVRAVLRTLACFEV